MKSFVEFLNESRNEHKYENRKKMLIDELISHGKEGNLKPSSITSKQIESLIPDEKAKKYLMKDTKNTKFFLQSENFLNASKEVLFNDDEFVKKNNEFKEKYGIELKYETPYDFYKVFFNNNTAKLYKDKTELFDKVIDKMVQYGKEQLKEFIGDSLENGLIRIEREIAVPQDKIDIVKYRGKLGQCWTFKEGNAKAKGAIGGIIPINDNETITYIGYVSPDDVDWNLTVIKNAISKEEAEIFVNKNAKIQMTSIEERRKNKTDILWQGNKILLA